MLQQAQAEGMRLWLTPPDRINFRGPQPAAAKWTPILKRHKPEIIALLKANTEPVADWQADDWRTYFDERAAVAEFDGAIPRIQAEQQAYRCCVAEWLCRNPVMSEPGQCAWCQRGGTDRLPLLPHGDTTHGHTWLHGECWSAWWAQRRQAAIAALAGLGIGGKE